MKKYIKSLFIFSFLTAILIFPLLASAAAGTPPSNSALNKLQTIAGAGGSGYTTDVSLPVAVGAIIRTVLGLLGIVFIIILIVAGFRWMVASGNEEKVTKAQGSIKRGIIGLIIVIGAWAIWTFLLNSLIGQ